MTKKIIITIIIGATIGVISAISIAFLMTPERRVKDALAKLAEEYYETEIYPEFKKLTDPEVIARYQQYGFSEIKLRQLENNKKNADYEYLTEICNIDKTAVKFYPTEPYEAKDVTTEYKYDCNF